jgi:hypothetical protein
LKAGYRFFSGIISQLLFIALLKEGLSIEVNPNYCPPAAKKIKA